MSTANFSQPTLSRIYAIGMEIDEQEEFDMELENVKEELREIKGYKEIDESRGDSLAMGAFYFNYFNREEKYWDLITIYVTIENGYYHGAMIDVDLSELEEISANLFPAILKKQVEIKLRQLEKVLAKNTLPLVRVATFSNGEAVYEKADNKRSLLKSIANGYAQWPGQIGNC